MTKAYPPREYEYDLDTRNKSLKIKLHVLEIFLLYFQDSTLVLTLRTPTLFNTLRTPRGGVHRTPPPFYLRCLPTDLDEIFTQCHVWYKLSKKYRTCSLRPIWRQLWRHNDFLKNGFSRIFKLFIFDFWNKIFRDEIPSPICCLICYTFEKNKKMAGKNR